MQIVSALMSILLRLNGRCICTQGDASQQPSAVGAAYCVFTLPAKRLAPSGLICRWSSKWEPCGACEFLDTEQRWMCWLLRFLAAGIPSQVCRVAEPPVPERMPQQQPQRQKQETTEAADVEPNTFEFVVSNIGIREECSSTYSEWSSMTSTFFDKKKG
ncbi:hypothetical protein Efla_002428 [Eimeria flavescens]